MIGCGGERVWWFLLLFLFGDVVAWGVFFKHLYTPIFYFWALGVGNGVHPLAKKLFFGAWGGTPVSQETGEKT